MLLYYVGGRDATYRQQPQNPRNHLSGSQPPPRYREESAPEEYLFGSQDMEQAATGCVELQCSRPVSRQVALSATPIPPISPPKKGHARKSVASFLSGNFYVVIIDL